MNRVTLSFLVFATAMISFASSAFAFSDDPPTRAGRLSYVKGSVSLQPGDADDWTWASINRPLTTGDNLWVARRGRAEIRIGSAAVRADQNTSLSVLNLDDDAAQFGLNSGTIIVHLRSLPQNGYFEIDTPNAAVSLLRAGDYRIETDESGDFTRVAVRTGKAEVNSNDDSFRIAQDSEAEITGSSRTNYDVYDLSPSDEFDRWSRQRDWRSARSPSARYVSTELTGYEDLDQNGKWFNDSNYGYVWQPSRVSSSWTPYREGRWAWVEPWGWTWMDDAPWGYATSHYGRWANLSGRGWAWVPPQRNAGSVAYVPVYSPANVVFIRETRVVYRDKPTVAWFPLGPGEAYVPAYHASHDYLARMNDTNTNWRNHERYDYNQRRYASQSDYSNVLIAGAVVAVASEIFSSAKPVQRSTVQVDPATFRSREIARTAPVAPVKASILSTSTAMTSAAAAPPREVTERKVVARKEPPPRRVKFDRKQAELQKTDGAPISADAEKKLGANAPAPVSAVTTVQAPATQAAPVDVSPKERNEQQRAERRQQHEEDKAQRDMSKEQREADRAAEKAEADKLRAQEEAQRKAEQSQQQQQADTARQQRDADRDAAKQAAEQKRADEEAARKAEQAQKQQESDQSRQQRDVEKQQADQQRAADEAARKADRDQKLDNQRRVREEADKRQAEEDAQKQAAKEEADKQRAEEEAQKKAEQDQKRQEAEQVRQQRDAERQQKQEEERAAREAAKQSRQPAGEADQPDATAEPDQTTTEEPVRRHKGQSPHQRDNKQDQPEQGSVTPPAEAPAEPQQQGTAEPAAPAPATASGPVHIEASDAEQKLVSQPKLKYPREAEKAGVEGTVKVQTVIGIDGKVKDAIAVEGPDELKDAARENVARRRYQPTIVDGKPVEVQTDVSVDFKKD